MSRNLLIVLALGLVASTGCRNRYNNQYGGGLFSGTPTIAAPGTYSLNIPSLANNQPYYVPGQTNPTSVATLDPRVSAPTNNNNTAQLNGWRPSAPESTNGGSTNFNAGQSNMGTPGTYANNGYSVPAGYRSASSTALPGSGMSYTDSTNYQSTGVDERNDRTRLAATDASNVRAPAQNNMNGGLSRSGQTQTGDPRFVGTFNSPAAGRFSNGLANSQSNSVVGQAGFRTTPFFTSPYGRTSPSVMAQSTTNFDPNGNGSQVGWRDRELGSESLNR